MESADSPPLVYIAGPYSTPDPVANTHSVAKVASELYRTGAVVPVVPHLTLLWQLIDPQPIEFWYEYDLHILRRCDAVLVLPGPSTGTDREVDRARKLGIPVFASTDEVLAWARPVS